MIWTKVVIHGYTHLILPFYNIFVVFHSKRSLLVHCGVRFLSLLSCPWSKGHPILLSCFTLLHSPTPRSGTWDLVSRVLCHLLTITPDRYTHIPRSTTDSYYTRLGRFRYKTYVSSLHLLFSRTRGLKCDFISFYSCIYLLRFNTVHVLVSKCTVQSFTFPHPCLLICLPSIPVWSERKRSIVQDRQEFLNVSSTSFSKSPCRGTSKLEVMWHLRCQYWTSITSKPTSSDVISFMTLLHSTCIKNQRVINVFNTNMMWYPLTHYCHTDFLCCRYGSNFYEMTISITIVDTEIV